MKLCVAILVLASFAYADDAVNVGSPQNSAYGYISKYGIPLAEKIRKQEQSRIIGGVPAVVGQYPSFAGLLGDIVGLDGLAVCGSSLISPSRLVTAAHCWNDGNLQIWRFTVVLGSTTLFTGGTRYTTSVVVLHPNWLPLLARNDVAVIYLPQPVTFSNTISPVALPSQSLISETFSGEPGIAIGFGVTVNGDVSTLGQGLNHVRLNVIGNTVCNVAFPLLVTGNNICTSGLGGSNICNGDSGGPLYVTRNNQLILAGISSFVSGLGCDANMPGVYTRTTSFLDFINANIG